MANYNFIGGDGISYGPYTVDQMRQFMAENRLTAQSQVSADGGPWQPAANVPELMGGGVAGPAPPIAQQGMPHMAGAPMPMGDTAYALSKVSAPATFMMVLGILNILMAIVLLLANLFFGGLGLAAADSGASQEGMGLVIQAAGGIVGNIVAIIVSSIIIIGSLKMKKLQSYGLSMTSAILCIICCVCCIGIGPGIWSLVVLCNAQVKAAFR